MQFMLILTEPESEIAKRNDPAQAAGYWAAGPPISRRSSKPASS